MGPTEICRLNYGKISGLEKDECPVWKKRKKTRIRHHTWLLRDAFEALKLYIAQRKRKEGEIGDDDPLFVTEDNGKRMTPQNLQFMMRGIRDRVADQIPEAQRVSSEINPLSLKYLRRAFGIACDRAKVGDAFKSYWMGHAEPYNGAYKSGQLPLEEQKQELEKVKPYLSITAPSEIVEQDIEEQRRKIIELREENVEQAREIEKLKEKFRTFEGLIISDLIREIDAHVTMAKMPAEEINEKLADVSWYDPSDEWVCNYEAANGRSEPDLDKLAELDVMKLKELRDWLREWAFESNKP